MNTRFKRFDLIKHSQLEVRVKKELKYENSNMNDVLPKRKEDLLNFIYYIVQLFKYNTKLHQDFNLEDPHHYVFQNKISSQYFQYLFVDKIPKKLFKEEELLENVLFSNMSKIFKRDNFYRLPLYNDTRKYRKNLQEAIQNRRKLSETRKLRVTEDFSNNELIVTRKNQNILMKILSGNLYKNSDEIMENRKNLRKNKVKNKDLRLFHDECDLEDLEIWDYEKFQAKINAKINNQYFYRKIEDFQENFYQMIFQDLKNKAIKGNNWSGANVLIIPKRQKTLEKIFKSLNSKFNFENFNKTKVLYIL